MVWMDQTKANKDLDVSDLDLNDIKSTPTSLKSDPFKSRSQVNVGSTKVVTITVYYSKGKSLVQGTKCLAWVLE